MTTNSAPSFYKFYAIRKSEFLKAPAVFLSWDDCCGYLKDASGQVEYQSFDVILHAMEYIYEVIKPPAEREEDKTMAASPSAKQKTVDLSPKKLHASGATPVAAVATIPTATERAQNEAESTDTVAVKNQTVLNNSWVFAPDASVPAGPPPPAAVMTPFFVAQPIPMPMPYPIMHQYPIDPAAMLHGNGLIPIIPRGPLPCLPDGQTMQAPSHLASGDSVRQKSLKNFQERLSELKEHHEATGNFEPQKEEDEELFSFVLEMRRQILQGSLPKRKAEQLKAIGFFEHAKEHGGLFETEIKLLEDYHEIHGTFDFDENGSREDARIKSFVRRMITEVCKFESDPGQSILNREQFDRLQDIGFVKYVKEQGNLLDRNIGLLKEYHEKHGTFDVEDDASNEDLRNLKSFVESMKQEIRRFHKSPGKSTLNSERFARLQEIGFVREEKERKDLFDQKIKLLNEYHMKHGNFDVVDESLDDASSKLNLAKFVQRMKWQVRKFLRNPEQSTLTQERFDQLTEIGFTQEVSVESPWNDKLQRLKAHYDQHGTWVVEDRELTSFKEKMRKEIRKYEEDPTSSLLNKEKYQLLKSIGLGPAQERQALQSWDVMFSRAQQYEAERPGNTIAEVGDQRLHNWLRVQKMKLRKAAKGETVNLTSQQLARLATLGRLVGDYKTMEDRIQDYVAYKKTYGQEPPYMSSLSKWLFKLKPKYIRWKLGEKTNLTQDQVNRLTEAGLQWPTEEEIHAFQQRLTPQSRISWDDRFTQLMDFKEENGHCRVPQLSGELGRWVKDQRKEYQKLKKGKKSSMNPERLAKLMEIGFVFSAHQHRGRRMTNEAAENSMDDSVEL